MGRGRIMRRNRNGKQKSGFRPNGNAALTGRPRSMLMGHKESDVTSGRGDRSRARRVPVRARVGAWAGNRPVFDKLRRQPRRVHERQLHRAFRHRSLALQARSPRDSSRALPVVGTPRAASTSLSLARSTGMVRPGRRRPRRRDLRARRGSASKPHGLPREVWPVVSSSLEELRRDPELRASLHPGRAPRPCSEFLEATSLAMLEADIGETRVHAHCPPFIEAHFWEWATDQVEEIRRLAKRSAAFHVPADSVVHGDLWEGNVLVGPDRWWIVDWDDLDLGDPAKDWTDWWWNVRSLPQPADRALAARLPLWQRARLLVEAVDAARGSGHRSAVRRTG